MVLKKSTIILFIKQYLKYILIIFCVIACGGVYILKGTHHTSNIKQSNPAVVLNKPKVVEKPVISRVFIDIKGAVNKPGVYELPSGSRVNQAIEISGGLAANADTSTINLSKKLTDEMVIIIYTKEDVVKIKNENTVVKNIEKECTGPSVVNDASIDLEDNNTNKDSSKKISLNEATAEELETLPGIGSSKATEIIKYREENGGFKNIEELQEISGIGSATFEKLKDLVTI